MIKYEEIYTADDFITYLTGCKYIDFEHIENKFDCIMNILNMLFPNKTITAIEDTKLWHDTAILNKITDICLMKDCCIIFIPVNFFYSIMWIQVPDNFYEVINEQHNSINAIPSIKIQKINMKGNEYGKRL